MLLSKSLYVNVRSVSGAMCVIAFLPLAWNIVARNEYKHHILSRLLRSRKLGVYVLAGAIFVGSALRDVAFYKAMQANTSIQLLPSHLPTSLLQILPSLPSHLHELYAKSVPMFCKTTGTALMAAGSTLVVSAFARLGVVNTYLGDYFGFTLDKKITSFPFSLMDSPMYIGATLNFFGAALRENNAIGALLSLFVALVYYISVKYFEDPFTSMIYANKAIAEHKHNSQVDSSNNNNNGGDSVAK